MKTGVSSYSFSRLVQSGAMTECEVVASAAAMGFEAIEFAELKPEKGVDVLTHAAGLREYCAEKGMTIVNYAVPADFLGGCGGNLETEIERVKQEVRVAASLGAPAMRHDASPGFGPDHVGPSDFRSALARLAEGCRAVTEFAADQGIRTMVENHGYFCQDSDRIEDLVCAVNYPNFGALVDIGNFACVDEDCACAVGRLVSYAFHVHIKDFHWKSGMLPFPGEGWFRTRGGNFLRGAIVGHGDLPVFQCLSLLDSAGYEGVISLEFEGMEEPLQGISLGHEYVRTLLKRLKQEEVV